MESNRSYVKVEVKVFCAPRGGDPDSVAEAIRDAVRQRLADDMEFEDDVEVEVVEWSGTL